MRGPVRMFAKRLWAQITGKVYLRVAIGFDAEANVWHVVETDIPGLWLEGDTPGELLNKLEQAGPEMIALNMDQIAAAYGLGSRRRNTQNFRADVVAPMVPAGC